MAPTASGLSVLAKPLASPAQLSTSGSKLDGVSAGLETSAIHVGARLTQIAGILLRLPQDLIAQAIVLFTRFWIGPEGGSLRECAIKVCWATKVEHVTYLTRIGRICSFLVSGHKAFSTSKSTEECYQRICLRCITRYRVLRSR